MQDFKTWQRDKGLTSEAFHGAGRRDSPVLSEGGGVAVINQEDMWELIRQRESNRKIPDDHTVRTELLLDARSNKKQKMWDLKTR